MVWIRVRSACLGLWGGCVFGLGLGGVFDYCVGFVLTKLFVLLH